MRKIAAILMLMLVQGCLQEQFDDESSIAFTEGPQIELVRSISGLDEDGQNAAIAEVERVAEGNFGITGALLRYEPVLIDPSDIIVGDLSQPNAIANTFEITLFGDVSYVATGTKFRPLDINNQASWQGVLNGGEAGKVSMSIHSGDTWPPSLVVRVDADPEFYLLLATDNVPYVYVAAEIDVEHVRSQKFSR